MYNPPKTVKVGPVNYTVRSYENLAGDDGKALWGHCNHTSLEVALNNGVAKDFERVVLMHELLHGIYHLSGLPDSEQEEQVVNSLAPLLVLLLRDNPKLVEYFCGKN